MAKQYYTEICVLCQKSAGWAGCTTVLKISLVKAWSKHDTQIINNIKSIKYILDDTMVDWAIAFIVTLEHWLFNI
jgi:hypothetical protein